MASSAVCGAAIACLATCSCASGTVKTKVAGNGRNRFRALAHLRCGRDDEAQDEQCVGPHMVKCTDSCFLVPW